MSPSRSDAAIAYCAKEESRVAGPYTFGNIPKKGVSQDLEVVKEKIVTGTTISTLCQDHWGTMIRHGKAIERYMFYMTKPVMRPNIECTYIWGPSGVGKTRYVYDNENPEYVYSVDAGKWFDGYDGHPIILIDEFDKQDFKNPNMAWYLRMLDRYPFKAEPKGGMTWCKAERFYLTANIPIEDLNITEQEKVGLKRRCKVIHMDTLSPSALRASPLQEL